MDLDLDECVEAVREGRFTLETHMDETEVTPLLYVGRYGRWDLCKVLLGWGANRYARNHQGQCVLCQTTFTSVCLPLMEYGIQPQYCCLQSTTPSFCIWLLDKAVELGMDLNLPDPGSGLSVMQACVTYPDLYVYLAGLGVDTRPTLESTDEETHKRVRRMYLLEIWVMVLPEAVVYQWN